MWTNEHWSHGKGKYLLKIERYYFILLVIWNCVIGKLKNWLSTSTRQSWRLMKFLMKMKSFAIDWAWILVLLLIWQSSAKTRLSDRKRRKHSTLSFKDRFVSVAYQYICETVGGRGKEWGGIHWITVCFHCDYSHFVCSDPNHYGNIFCWVDFKDWLQRLISKK